jgi:hypothetical protein
MSSFSTDWSGMSSITLLLRRTPSLFIKESDISSTSLRALPSLPVTTRSLRTKYRSRTRVMLLKKSGSRASSADVTFESDVAASIALTSFRDAHGNEIATAPVAAVAYWHSRG